MKKYYLNDSITLKRIIDDKKFLIERGSIWYFVDKGMYLAFDTRDLSYIGIEMCFLARAEEYEQQCKQTLKDLIKANLVEERDE